METRWPLGDSAGPPAAPRGEAWAVAAFGSSPGTCCSSTARSRPAARAPRRRTQSCWRVRQQAPEAPFGSPPGRSGSPEWGRRRRSRPWAAEPWTSWTSWRARRPDPSSAAASWRSAVRARAASAEAEAAFSSRPRRAPRPATSSSPAGAGATRARTWATSAAAAPPARGCGARRVATSGGGPSPRPSRADRAPGCPGGGRDGFATSA
mmetsp:Transcript_82010/g.265702  ORF Transcript_82010/g.265702 Transcript_82010/m.265702 type:complete len:208 (-) Transcript_82010:4841-5464(-)